MASYPIIREKYMSAGTIDNFSLDTALTMPSTPKQGSGSGSEAAAAAAGGEDNKLLREEMQTPARAAEGGVPGAAQDG